MLLCFVCWHIFMAETGTPREDPQKQGGARVPPAQLQTQDLLAVRKRANR